MSLKSKTKTLLKKVGLFDKVKKLRDDCIKKSKLTKKYIFENRSNNSKKVCLILAGYKPFLFEIVFKRIKKFVPEDIDVCICSSGLYSEELSRIASENNWSYLSTKKNNVSLIQNVAINLFEKAEYIYKLDEDIFITEGFFETLMKTYLECEKNGPYKPGFIAPIIPINAFGNLYILNRFNLMDTYSKKFEKPLRMEIRENMIGTNAEVAKFFWGEGKYLPNIDVMNKRVQDDKFEYEACPIRFNIGAILFKKEFWKEMKMFNVSSDSGMGADETQICEYCVASSNAIIVSKNSIVGHLSFGPQNESMKKYFEEHKELFDID